VLKPNTKPVSRKPIGCFLARLKPTYWKVFTPRNWLCLEYDESVLIDASDMATKEELNIEEIHETDINRVLDALIEHGEYYGK
jgi:hypothetical protein